MIPFRSRWRDIRATRKTKEEPAAGPTTNILYLREVHIDISMALERTQPFSSVSYTWLPTRSRGYSPIAFHEKLYGDSRVPALLTPSRRPISKCDFDKDEPSEHYLKSLH